VFGVVFNWGVRVDDDQGFVGGHIRACSTSNHQHTQPNPSAQCTAHRTAPLHSTHLHRHRPTPSRQRQRQAVKRIKAVAAHPAASARDRALQLPHEYILHQAVVPTELVRARFLGLLCLGAFAGQLPVCGLASDAVALRLEVRDRELSGFVG